MDFQTLKPVSIHSMMTAREEPTASTVIPLFCPVKGSRRYLWSKMTRTKVDSRILSNEPLLESTVGQTPQCSINYNVALWLCRRCADTHTAKHWSRSQLDQQQGQGTLLRSHFNVLFYPPDFVEKIARTLVSSCRILCSMGLSCLVRLLDRFLVNVLTVDTNVSHYYNSFLTNISIVLSNIGHLILASGFNY